MNQFKIEYLLNNKKSEDIIDASSLNDAYNIAKKRNLLVLDIESINKNNIINNSLNLHYQNRKISIDDQIQFFEQLTLLLTTGISLFEALHYAKESTTNKHLKTILDSINLSLNKGKSLFEAIYPYKEAFGNLTISMIQLAQQSGNLTQTLKDLTQILKETQIMKNNFKKATTYPRNLMITMVVAFVVLINMVIPKFNNIFNQYQQELPIPTKILISIESFISSMISFEFLLYTFLSYSIYWYLKHTTNVYQSIKYFLTKNFLRHTFLHNYYISHISYTLQALIKAGIPLNEALILVGNSSNNLYYKKQLKKVANYIHQGQNITKSFEKSELFNKIGIKIILTGEKTGALDTMMEHLHHYYKEQYQKTLDKFLNSLEPLLLLIVALFVLLLSLGIFMPIWDIQKTINLS